MPLSTLQETPRDVPSKTRGQDGFATSFPVGLLHPLQHAGLSRRSQVCPSSAHIGTKRRISYLRISPDGNLLAFEQHVHNGDDGYLVIADREGKQKFASQVFSSLLGLAWRPDGKEVWFTGSPHGAARTIYAVDMRGKQRLVLRAPGSVLLHDIASNGRVLLTSDNNRKQMFVLIDGDKKERNISWLDWSVLQVLSEDGRQVLFAEGGEANPKYGLYLRRLDGSLPKRIVDGYWGDLSPDGTCPSFAESAQAASERRQ